jgi:hypothetical protein
MFWSDITGFRNKLKIFSGDEKLIDEFLAQLDEEASQNVRVFSPLSNPHTFAGKSVLYVDTTWHWWMVHPDN